MKAQSDKPENDQAPRSLSQRAKPLLDKAYGNWPSADEEDELDPVHDAPAPRAPQRQTVTDRKPPKEPDKIPELIDVDKKPEPVKEQEASSNDKQTTPA